MAAKASAKTLRVLKTSEPDFDVAWKQVCQRRPETGESVEKDVKKIIDRVRKGGDKELFACVRKYDGAKLESLEVTRDGWDDACDRVDPGDRAAIGKAAITCNAKLVERNNVNNTKNTPSRATTNKMLIIRLADC